MNELFMYNLQKNNYHQKPKPSNIQTPKEVSQFIFELLRDKITYGKILDPCCGEGNLLKPWKENNYQTFGIDNDQSLVDLDLRTDFLNLDNCSQKCFEFYLASEWRRGNYSPTLILCNPPFNGYGHKLGSEVWLDKIIELFGKEVPIVLFAPYNFRLPWKTWEKNSKRWNKLTNDKYPPLSSIISLPQDIFPGVVFHSEILIFNIPNLQPHYFFKNYARN